MSELTSVLAIPIHPTAWTTKLYSFLYTIKYQQSKHYYYLISFKKS